MNVTCVLIVTAKLDEFIINETYYEERCETRQRTKYFYQYADLQEIFILSLIILLKM